MANRNKDIDRKTILVLLQDSVRLYMDYKKGIYTQSEYQMLQRETLEHLEALGVGKVDE